ncbi:MAG: YitT family protein [Oscillospiraceae bacterium]|nr:YitT family protein [Oscillospiraceae bacterium]
MKPSPREGAKALIRDYLLILVGSALYAVSTVLFIFPDSLLLGGTSGISVILEAYLPFSPGTILMAINLALIVLAFFVLGREMATKTLVGSVATTLLIGLFEGLIPLTGPVLPNIYLSALVGAGIVAVASGVMFYVQSSSGGTDIIALIVKKFFRIHIGRALLITDVLIVLVGGLLSGIPILIGSFAGLLVKTLGIDLVIWMIQKVQKKGGEDATPGQQGD